jgi:2-polyprenyl-6-methoxyphenol hydroxylase-like FAD-dependent oxidoreductase
MDSQQFTAETSANDTPHIFDFDVIIAGCGPTGAMLAAELRLHDVRVLVVEKDTEPVSFVRIVALHMRSLELMAMRGLLNRVREHGRQRPAGGFFAAIDPPGRAGPTRMRGRRIRAGRRGGDPQAR